MFSSNLPLAWFYLPLAFILGGLHALEPGHGKSLAAAYLISGKHQWRDAVILGVATTLSHTAVVILLAFGGLLLKDQISTGALSQGIALIGALALILVGLWTAFTSGRDLWAGVSARYSHGHEHSHGHPHSHSQGDLKATPGDEEFGFWRLGLLGLSNGALPCPGALAALMVALAVGKIALGLATVLIYSLGLASVLSLIGLFVIEAGRRMKSYFPSERWLSAFPMASGLIVFATGLWLLVANLKA
jgi:nickel/cobalt exporter